MKKNLLVLFFLSVLVLLPILNGFYLSHDSITHLGRAAFYENAIKDGQFPPRWAAGANYGYGSPFFIFYYPLSGYAIALVHMLGMSFEFSYILVSVFTFLLGVGAYYLWIRKLFDKKIAFYSTIFYTVLPYKFLTLYVRGGIGEFMSFSILPLFFLILERSKAKVSSQNVLWGGIVYAAIMLSHNAIALIFTPIFIIYAYLRGKSSFKSALMSTGIGLLMSAYFWIPALVEAKYTGFNKYFGQMYQEHFPSIQRLVFSSVGFGPDVNRVGGLSPQIGIGAFIVLGVVVWLLWKKKIKKDKGIILFWIFLFLVGLFISTEFSKVLWANSSFLQKFQFPWRFIVIPSFAACILVSYVFSKLKNDKLIWLFLVAVISYGISLSTVQKHISYSDSYYYNYPGSTYFHNEATTIWSAGDPYEKAKRQIEFIQGEGVISKIVKRTSSHTFIVEAKTDSTLVDHTVYFPGWRAYVNGSEVPIQFQDINHRGVITFPVPLGKSDVVVKFTETKVRQICDIISGLTILTVVIFLFSSALRKRNIV